MEWTLGIGVGDRRSVWEKRVVITHLNRVVSVRKSAWVSEHVMDLRPAYVSREHHDNGGMPVQYRRRSRAGVG